MKILVVDDDTVTRRLLGASLEGAGHEVVEAADGQAGLALWEDESIRMVITDWVMPEMEGTELIRYIRSAKSPAYTYILMLTAKEHKSDIIAGLETGADDYLIKPFDPGELQARVAIGERILRLEERLSQALVQMERLATLDSLTGLPNRRAIYSHAKKEMARARRKASPFSLILLDIDHFKSVNDRYGHLVGDQALLHVATTLDQNKRIYDGVGRWGGEEFLLVLPDTTPTQGQDIAERLRAALAETGISLDNGETLHLQASLGVACVEQPDLYELEFLLQKADEALYQAKEQGRNRVCLVRP